jgi:hypothetical protein
MVEEKMTFFMRDLFDKKEVPEDLKPKEEKMDDALARARTRRLHEEVVEKQESIRTDADYKKYGPGTPEWKTIWKAHPELQNEMLEFAKHHFIFCPEKHCRIPLYHCEYMCQKCDFRELVANGKNM